MILGGGSVAVYSLFIVALTICGHFVLGTSFYAVLCVFSGFAIISLGKRELVGLLLLSCCCKCEFGISSSYSLALWVQRRGPRICKDSRKHKYDNEMPQ